MTNVVYFVGSAKILCHLKPQNNYVKAPALLAYMQETFELPYVVNVKIVLM